MIRAAWKERYSELRDERSEAKIRYYGWQNLRLYVVNYGSVRLFTVESTATYGTEVAGLTARIVTVPWTVRIYFANSGRPLTESALAQSQASAFCFCGRPEFNPDTSQSFLRGLRMVATSILHGQLDPTCCRAVESCESTAIASFDNSFRRVLGLSFLRLRLLRSVHSRVVRLTFCIRL